MKMDLNKTAKIFIEAFDMDMQIFLKNVNRQLAHTAGGQSIIMWAKSNPIKFNALLHMISIAIQQIPDAGGILITIVKSQLVRLPAEILGIVDEHKNISTAEIAADNVSTSTSDSQPINDSQNLSEDEYALAMSVVFLRNLKKNKTSMNKEKMSLNDFLLWAPKGLIELLPFFSNVEMKEEDKNNFIESCKKLTDYSEEKMIEEYDKLTNIYRAMPRSIMFEAIELTRIHSVIINKIKGKNDDEALEIFQSEYTNRIFDSIKKINNNDQLDSETKQSRIDSFIRMYRKFLDSVDQFNPE